MAENKNVAMVDDLEAIVRPTARLGNGMVGRMQTSATRMAMGEGPTVTEYINATLNGSEECPRKTMYLSNLSTKPG